MKSKTYTQKPMVIEALQFTDNINELKEFVGKSLVIENYTQMLFPFVEENTVKLDRIFIKTSRGNLEVHPSDYIIKCANGDFCPCEKDKFEKVYMETVQEENNNDQK